MSRTRRGPIQAAAGGEWANALGCEKLGRLGLLDTSECCERCHSAETYAPGRFFLGPCRVTLPDGRTASVCCAGKKRLGGAGS